MRVQDAMLTLIASYVAAEMPSCQQEDETSLLQLKGTATDGGGQVQTPGFTPTPGFAFPEPDLPPFTEPSEETAAPPPQLDWPVNAMGLQVLDEATYGDVGGRVLDGSMGNYWYGRGTSNLWVIHQDGGGSCNFLSDNPDAQFDCPWWFNGKQRSYRTQNGNGPRQPYYIGNGLLDVNDESFGDAHHVRVPYLTGDSYLGQWYDRGDNGCRPVKDTDEEYEVADWDNCEPYFSGHLLLRNIIHHILSNQPDSRQMTKILLTGSSAGGRSSIMNCDWLDQFMKIHKAELGMQEVEVSCAPVAGYMLPGRTADHEDPKNVPTPWPQWSIGEVRTTEQEAAFSLVEGELHRAYTNPLCRAAQEPGEEWRCQAAYVAHGYVGPRVFISQNTHDFVHMWMFLPSGDFRWNENRDGPLPDDLRETCEGQKFMGYYGNAMENSLLYRMNERPNDGLFLPSCYDHTRNTRYHGTRFDQNYRQRTTINGYDSLQAVTAWFFHQVNQRVILTDNCETELGAPCNPTCLTHIEDVSADCCLSALQDRCGDSLNGIDSPTNRAHSQCLACARQNRHALIDAGCTIPVVQQACNAAPPSTPN
jgi:hypothetical protein